jgi:hypothetical protein
MKKNSSNDILCRHYFTNQGQWAQPSMLGYSVLVSGLLLASINMNLKTE